MSCSRSPVCWHPKQNNRTALPLISGGTIQIQTRTLKILNLAMKLAGRQAAVGIHPSREKGRWIRAKAR